MITQEILKELLIYDKNSGAFVWKKKRRGVPVGKKLGCDNGFGYLRITVLGRSYYAHRLAWMYEHGVWPSTVDHINGIKSDNRIANLRSCSQLENNQNTHGPQRNSNSKVLGVSWHKKAKKWQAYICTYKERKYLGLFSNIDDANKAYKAEKEKLNVFSSKKA